MTDLTIAAYRLQWLARHVARAAQTLADDAGEIVFSPHTADIYARPMPAELLSLERNLTELRTAHRELCDALKADQPETLEIEDAFVPPAQNFREVSA